MKLHSANSRLIGEARDRVVRDFDAGGLTFKKAKRDWDQVEQGKFL